MEAYEVTQALMSASTVYHVRKPRAEGLLYTIRGELMTTVPRFHLVEGDQGKALADLTANFVKTKYEITSPDAKVLGNIVFPAVAFNKTLTLTIGEDVYKADGGVFKGVFQCKQPDGTIILEIRKELSFRDTVLVKVTEPMALEIGLLTAVGIHSRFYEMI